MAKNINIRMDEQEYESLKKTKQKYGLTWLGMLQRGGIYMENIPLNNERE